VHLPSLGVVLAGADLLCPERCAACSAIVGASVLFCHDCLAAVTLLGPQQGPVCVSCAANTDGVIRHARAWAAYDGTRPEPRPIARALAAFKYHATRRLGRRLAAAMLTRVPSEPGAIVAPVPLHPRQLRRRGFNQSAILARCLARELGWPVALRLLTRTRDTPSQTALSIIARSANVAGVFAVPFSPAVRGRTILLIDDVWTSGATVRAAATALRQAGAYAVDVLTFARVL
jgi:ComF family protein